MIIEAFFWANEHGLHYIIKTYRKLFGIFFVFEKCFASGRELLVDHILCDNDSLPYVSTEVRDEIEVSELYDIRFRHYLTDDIPSLAE